MAIRKFKPITNGTRNMSTLVNEEITKATPLKKLTKKTKSNSGRNNQGKITVRHRGGGVKRKYRVIDFKRNKDGVIGTVASIEYDPNRSANIALINYADGEKRYIIAPLGLNVGDKIESGENVDIKVGNIGKMRSFGSNDSLYYRFGVGYLYCRYGWTGIIHIVEFYVQP